MHEKEVERKIETNESKCHTAGALYADTLPQNAHAKLIEVPNQIRQIIRAASPKALQDDSNKAFSDDQKVRTSDSFTKAVETGKKLGKENECALELQTRDWLVPKKNRSPLSQARGNAALAEALGEFRLEEGSRLDLRSHECDKSRILKGKDYDFGGEATTWLRTAAGNLVNAQTFVIGHKDEIFDGQKLDSRYMQQLKLEQARAESKLNLIYGKHDMESVYKELVKQVHDNSQDFDHAIFRLKAHYDVMQGNDPLCKAKTARDLSVAFLAEAEVCGKAGNGEEARIYYGAANDHLKESLKLDENAPDNRAISKIRARLAANIINYEN